MHAEVTNRARSVSWCTPREVINDLRLDTGRQRRARRNTFCTAVPYLQTDDCTSVPLQHQRRNKDFEGAIITWPRYFWAVCNRDEHADRYATPTAPSSTPSAFLVGFESSRRTRLLPASDFASALPCPTSRRKGPPASQRLLVSRVELAHFERKATATRTRNTCATRTKRFPLPFCSGVCWRRERWAGAGLLIADC